jgi:predicted nucleic acid-binding protein
MQKVIISDASCIILLEKIGELSLLQNLFGIILITQEVYGEFGGPLPEWIKVTAAQNKLYQKILQVSLDDGESSSIALAMENPHSLLIIDELKGRKYAKELGIKITGTLGVIAQAKLSGHINSVKPLLNKIKKTNFRISADLERVTIFSAKEEL